jgi:hypothetical protein
MSNSIQRDFLFHVYIGTAYQGPQRAANKHAAIRLYAQRVKKSELIFHAVQVDAEALVKEHKQARA